MVWLFVVITFILFCWKWTWFREKIFTFLLSKKGWVKLLLLVLLIYFIWWSFINYCFYINLFILQVKLGYGLIESINIASNLTNELSTGFYYFTLFITKLFGNGDINTIISELEVQILQITNLYGDLSSMNSGVEAINNLINLLF